MDQDRTLIEKLGKVFNSRLVDKITTQSDAAGFGQKIDQYLHWVIDGVDRFGDPTKVAFPFVSLVKNHLTKLDWNQSDLARKTKISTAQVSGWLYRRNRSITRGEVNNIALAIVNGYAEQSSKNVGRAKAIAARNFDGILSELLHAAGYAAIDGRGQDLIWNRLAGQRDRAQRRLVVGWSHLPGYAEEESGRIFGEGADFTIKLARQLQAVVEWKHFPFSDLIPELRESNVDLLMPLMNVPFRGMEIAMSLPIPGLNSGFNGVISKENARVLRPDHKEYEWEDLEKDKSKLAVNYIASGIGEVARSVFESNCESPHSDINSAVEYILSTSDAEDNERVRCLILDEEAAKQIAEKHKRELELLFQEKSSPTYSYAFFVHIDEPRFLTNINAALQTIADMETLKESTSKTSSTVPN